MSGERIDYGIERRRHDGFVGRAELLARLDQLNHLEWSTDDLDEPLWAPTRHA